MQKVLYDETETRINHGAASKVARQRDRLFARKLSARHSRIDCPRPGQRPHNSMSVGAIVKRPDGYLWVKLAEPNKWIQVHRKIWQEAHGPVQTGMVLSFKDGNHDNCSIGNLELVTRRDVMLRNTLHNLPKEITELIQLRAVITRQINNGAKS